MLLSVPVRPSRRWHALLLAVLLAVLLADLCVCASAIVVCPVQQESNASSSRAVNVSECTSSCFYKVACIVASSAAGRVAGRCLRVCISILCMKGMVCASSRVSCLYHPQAPGLKVSHLGFVIHKFHESTS